MNIGHYLKKIRLDQNLILKDVADKLNITVSLLSQIENDKASPSWQTLESLLKYYTVNFSDFFRQIEQKSYIMVRKDEAECIENLDNGCSFTLLASKLQNNSLESYSIQLRPDALFLINKIDTDNFSERFVYIESGAASIELENINTFILNAGDSINFKSSIDCSVKNAFNGISKILVNGAPPLINQSQFIANK